jgi:hypothetical protein
MFGWNVGPPRLRINRGEVEHDPYLLPPLSSRDSRQDVGVVFRFYSKLAGIRRLFPRR